MKLYNIKIRNFQGLEDWAFDFQGCHAEVSGRNGSGKTTVSNAISWLLTNKALAETKNFDPHPLDAKGDRKHDCTTSVSLEVELDDKTHIVFTKKNSEYWVKARKTRVMEYRGDTNNYEIDGAKVSETVFLAKIAELFGDEDHIRMLLSPSYFAADIDWKKRRAMLFEMVGTISNDEVFKADADLEPLKGEMGDYEISDFRFKTYVTRKKLYEQKKEAETRIDEAKATIDKTVKEKKEDIEKKISDIEKDEKTLEDEEKKVRLSFDRSDVKAEIQQKKIEYAEAKAEHNKKCTTGNEPVLAEIAICDTKILELNDKLLKGRRYAQDVDDFRASLESWKKAIELKQDQYGKLTFEPKAMPAVETVCPYCGQAMPQEKIDSAIAAFKASEEKRKAEWQAERDKMAEAIEKDVKDYEKKSAALPDKIAAIIDFAAVEKEIAGIEERKAALKGKLITGIDFEETQTARDMTAVLQELDEKMKIDPAELKAALEPVENRRTELADAKKEFYDILGKIQMNETVSKRLESHKATLASLLDEIKTNEELIELADRFISVRARILDERVAKYFQNVKFRFFESQKDGQVKDACVSLIPSSSGLVPYEQASTAERINGGLEIVESLGKWVGYTMPVLIDNVESVNELKSTKAQQIRFRVTDGPLADKLTATVSAI